MRIQRGYGVLKIQNDTRNRLLAFFEAEGFQFAPEINDSRGPGVFWGRYPGRVIG